jgi:hypothetical protein
MGMVECGELMIRWGSESARPTLRAPRSTPKARPGPGSGATYWPPVVFPCLFKISCTTSSVMSISGIL